MSQRKLKPSKLFSKSDFIRHQKDFHNLLKENIKQKLTLLETNIFLESLKNAKKRLAQEMNELSDQTRIVNNEIDLLNESIERDVLTILSELRRSAKNCNGVFLFKKTAFK